MTLPKLCNFDCTVILIGITVVSLLSNTMDNYLQVNCLDFCCIHCSPMGEEGAFT